MEKIIEFVIYAAKCLFDPKGMAEAINSAETVEELDEMVLGKKEKHSACFAGKQSAAEATE